MVEKSEELPGRNLDEVSGPDPALKELFIFRQKSVAFHHAKIECNRGLPMRNTETGECIEIAIARSIVGLASGTEHTGDG